MRLLLTRNSKKCAEIVEYLDRTMLGIRRQIENI